MSDGNVFDLIPENLDSEVLEDIVNSDNVRIERIVSRGHASPESGWYDQDENEWVIVLKGSAKLVFDDGADVCLEAGHYINIPAHKKHRVAWTDPDVVTIWLAIFYK
jgi:cupin 2 domain-containing protein